LLRIAGRAVSPPPKEKSVPRGHSSGSPRLGPSARLRMYCAPTNPACLSPAAARPSPFEGLRTLRGQRGAEEVEAFGRAGVGGWAEGRGVGWRDVCVGSSRGRGVEREDGRRGVSGEDVRLPFDVAQDAPRLACRQWLATTVDGWSADGPQRGEGTLSGAVREPPLRFAPPTLTRCLVMGRVLRRGSGRTEGRFGVCTSADGACIPIGERLAHD